MRVFLYLKILRCKVWFASLWIWGT